MCGIPYLYIIGSRIGRWCKIYEVAIRLPVGSVYAIFVCTIAACWIVNKNFCIIIAMTGNIK